MHTNIRMAGAAAIVGLVASAAPALAQSTTITDPVGDAEDYADIVSVKAQHGKGNLLVTTGFESTPYDITNVVIDTNPRRKGAEFRAEGYLAWDGPALNLYRGNKLIRCKAGKFARLNQVTVKHTIPRSCLRSAAGIPGKVRIRVTSNGDEFEWVHDAAPGKRTFSKWVRAAR